MTQRRSSATLAAMPLPHFPALSSALLAVSVSPRHRAARSPPAGGLRRCLERPVSVGRTRAEHPLFGVHRTSQAPDPVQSIPRTRSPLRHRFTNRRCSTTTAKRPYTLVPLTTTQVPVPRYFDKAGKPCRPTRRSRESPRRLRNPPAARHPLPAAPGVCRRCQRRPVMPTSIAKN